MNNKVGLVIKVKRKSNKYHGFNFFLLIFERYKIGLKDLKKIYKKYDKKQNKIEKRNYILLNIYKIL